MNTQLIPKSSYRRSLWKNGLGHTDEIAIFPAEASLARGDFLWRLSSARIEKASAFSMFPAHDRVLVVLEGKGIRMIHTFDEGELPELIEIPLLESYEFPGDVPSRCELLEGPITDFSIFTRTGEVGLSHLAHEIEPRDEYEWQPHGKSNYAYLISGQVSIDGIVASAGDTLSTSDRPCLIQDQGIGSRLILICFEY